MPKYKNIRTANGVSIKSILSFLLILIIHVELLGCATTVPSAPVVSTKSCCKKFSEFDFIPLLENEEVKLKISSLSPVHKFESGTSYHQAIEMPNNSGKATLSIRSHPSSMLILSAWYYFPAVAFLDKNYNELEVKMDESFPFHLYGWDGLHTYKANIEVPAIAKYAVIHTPESKVGSDHTSTIDTTETTIMVGSTFVSLPGGKQVRTVRLGPTGTIYVTYSN